MALLAQSAAYKEKLISEVVPLDQNLIQRLKEARDANKIAVIIVDTWTLRLPRYREFMREYDEVNLWNTAVLIPWNIKDDETISCRSQLESAVRVAFINKTHPKDPHCFRDEINSPEQLKRDLEITLCNLRSKIIEVTNDLRKAESDQTIPHPVIVGPSWRTL